MNKTYIRPFWSYDVQKTEKWLEAMASNGYHLVEVDFKLRLFKFTRKEAKVVIYRLTYDKVTEKKISSGLSLNGWEIICSNKHWSVFVNENLSDNISTFPTRHGIIKRNRAIMYTSGLMICFTIGFFMSITVLIVQAITGSKMPVIKHLNIFVLTSILCATSIYPFFKLLVTNKKLRKEVGNYPNLSFSIPKENLYDKKTEKRLIKEKKIIIKRKIAWMYSPDKLEDWLENMEKQGFNLYRMSRPGNAFYFMKGESRIIKYCADFQNSASEDYYEIHKEAGWKLIFTSPFNLQRWTVWSKLCSGGDETPELYSNKTDALKYAKKVALTFSIMFIPLIIIYCVLLVKFIVLSHSMKQMSHDMMLDMVIFCIIIIEFGTFAVRTNLYYLRLKNKYN